MIDRSGLTLTITFTDEESLKAIEWLLTRILQPSASGTSIPPASLTPLLTTPLPHTLPSDAKLAGLERERALTRRLQHDRADLVARNRSGLMPFRTEKPPQT